MSKLKISQYIRKTLVYVRGHQELLTITLALCALFFTSYQAYLQRSHNRVSVQPIIIAYWDNAKTSPHGVFVEAAGIGPGIIRDIKVKYNGEASFYDVTYNDYCKMSSLENCGEWPKSALFFDTGWYSQASLVDPSDKWIVIGIRTKGFKKLSWESQSYLLTNISQDLVIEVHYCSVYDDCWDASSYGKSVNPVCPISDGEIIRPCSKQTLIDVLVRLSDPL